MSIYKRVSGIRPSPLQNLHLQPSDAPPSATKAQLNLFDRVLGRRKAQLQDLPLASLSTVYSLLSEPENPTAEEIRVLLKELPNKEPTTEDQYVSIILFLLIGNFHKSIDTREKKDNRQHSLKKVHHVLSCCDIAYTDHIEVTEKQTLQKQKEAEEKKQRELEEERKNAAEELKRNRDKLRDLYHQKVGNSAKVPKQPAQQKGTDLVTKAAKEEEMGAILSGHQKQASAGQLNGHQQSSAGQEHDAIEILDSDDEVEAPSAAQKQPAVAPAVEPAKAAAKPPETSQSKPPVSATSSSYIKPRDVMSEEEYKEYLASATSKTKSTRSVSSIQNAEFLPVPGSLAIASTRHTISFQPDVKAGTMIYSSSLVEERMNRNLVLYQGQSHSNPNYNSFIDGRTLNDVYNRYSAWDPYWEVHADLSLHIINGFSVGYKTSVIDITNKYSECPPLSAVEIQFQIGDLARSLKKGSFNKGHGELRLMLRALPLVVPEKYKKLRSDTHLWPKGTFVQINSSPIALSQRKQQSHDHTLWKGMCYMYDLTNDALRVVNPSAKQKLEICTKDADAYNFQLAICSYLPPEVLVERCIGDGPNSLPKLSYEEGCALMKQNLGEKDAVVIDDSDGENDTAIDPTSIYLTCSLLCGVSMSAIKVPVRGKRCKHMQCFDLANYLHSNSMVSGGRWRCLVCEDFVPVKDLMIDDFIAKIIEKHGKEVNSSRDKVEIYRDGTWKFLSENRLKYSTKRSSTSDLPDSKRSKSESNISAQAEVIDIDD